MYGIVKQLVAVGKNWSELKDMFLRGETLPRPYREEGIILKPYKVDILITLFRPIRALVKSG